MSEDQDDADKRELTVRQLLDTLAASRERRTSRERHGNGELVRLDGIQYEASGCLLPDGTVTSAQCLTRRAHLADDDWVWSRPVTPGKALRRRGRLRIEPEALRFVDEIGADAPRLAAGEVPLADLERDLAMSARMRGLVGDSDLFAQLLYAALCGTVWRHEDTGRHRRVGWRSAGAVVAGLRGGGDYMDWYCSGNEVTVDEQVLAEVRRLGWDLLQADDAGLC